MKKIVINDNNLDNDSMEMEVVRVKGLIINPQGRILLAHNNNTYQFPGGHKEENESNEEFILREIKEETGIDLEMPENPFLCIETFDNNYFDTGKKVLNRIYYYRFITDKEPILSETHYDELELETEFNLFYVPFSELDKFIEKQMDIGNMDKKIGREMLFVIEEYKNIYGESI